VNTVLNLLALAGVAAAVWHLARAASRFVRGGAAGIWADEMGRTHARHGDLTALDESRRDRSEAIRGRRRAGLEALAWLAMLGAPSLTPWPRALFAVYALFWIGPAGRAVRPGGRGR
jgi:hypothetical protein